MLYLSCREILHDNIVLVVADSGIVFLYKQLFYKLQLQ